ncbi:UbiD family decarboxylase [Natronobeatus ordinarius]|uniref:UbiD family decarboxylase n=1 Tax=Natronobeatus ordinarius TaxID=2963433 RepID=UPI0020CE2F20|nr:UbiD family decarboxylase [Natronobeatus ordinarius]
MVGVNSFREYLGLLDAHGMVNRIERPVSWNLEASAITMLANEQDVEIPLFESVADTDSIARLVGDPYRGAGDRPWDKVALGMGLSPSIGGDEYYDEAISRLRSPIDPITVPAEQAACKEVVRVGETMSLLSFPWPYIHDGDGGRYSTLHSFIAPDPNTDGESWDQHRLMIHGHDRASALLLAGEQIPNNFYYQYAPREEEMPFAVAIGVEPAVTFASPLWVPTDKTEAQFAGGLKRAPIELVECETNGLRVPASAEVVIEGHVRPDRQLDEGPYGDYVGYINGPRRSMPELQIDAITHREDPYIPFCVDGCATGYTFNSNASLEVACAGPDMTIGLRAGGFDVERVGVWQYAEKTMYVFSTDVSEPGYFHEAANFVFTTWGMLHVDFFVFVDGDVDPLDQRAVLEAVALHADPDEDFHQFGVETMPKVPLNIYQTPDEKGDTEPGTSKTRTAKAYINATRRERATGVEQAIYADDRLAARARELLDRAIRSGDGERTEVTET